MFLKIKFILTTCLYNICVWMNPMKLVPLSSYSLFAHLPEIILLFVYYNGGTRPQRFGAKSGRLVGQWNLQPAKESHIEAAGSNAYGKKGQTWF